MKIEKRLKIWRVAQNRRGYFNIPTPWIAKIITDKEINEIRSEIEKSATYKSWVEQFGRDKLRHAVLSKVDTDTLREISLLCNLRLPLPFRLQRLINYFWTLNNVPEEYGEYREVVAISVVLVRDEELREYLPKVISLLEYPVEKISKGEEWTNIEYKFTTNVITRVADARVATCAFFLRSLEGAGITQPNPATSCPRLMEEVKSLCKQIREQGVTSRILDDFLGEGGKKGVLDKYQYEVEKVITGGKIIPLTFDKKETTTTPGEDILVVKNKVEVLESHLKSWEQELATLSKRRREVLVRVKEARELGDISENAEYDAAQEDLRSIDSRISTLKDYILRSEVVDKKSTDTVSIGSRVKLRDILTKTTMTLEIVAGGVKTKAPDEEGGGSLSVDSPVGKTILGRRAGALVRVDVEGQDRPVLYKIISVE